MEEFLKVIGALNDESRVKILKFLIIHGKSCVCELENSLDMIQSRLSRHLKILKDGGFLEVERIGTYAYYYLTPRTNFHQTALAEIGSMSFEVPHKYSTCAS